MKRLWTFLNTDVCAFFKRWCGANKVVEPALDPSSFGSIAVQMGFVTEDTVQKAVNTDLRVGEILVYLGHLTVDQCEEILIQQQRQRAKTWEDKVSAELRLQRNMLRRATTGLTSISLPK